MVHSKYKNVSCYIVVGLVAFLASHVQAENCNGKTVTTHITKLKQFEKLDSDSYRLTGTRGDDIILVEIPKSEFTTNWWEPGENLEIKLRGSGVVGGDDYVCFNASPRTLKIKGGKYLDISGPVYLGISDLKDSTTIKARSQYVDIKTGDGKNKIYYRGPGPGSSENEHRIVTGNGDDIIEVHSAPIMQIQSNDGDDEIIISDTPYIALDAGRDDDIVSITLDNYYGTKYFVIGGSGDDHIETVLPSGVTKSDSRGWIFGSDIWYSGDSVRVGSNFLGNAGTKNISDFESAAYVFFDHLNADDILPRINYDVEYDSSGGEISVEGGINYIYGTDGVDYLRGGNDKDYIYGKSGNDRIWGGDGDDYLDGGNGDDDIYGEDGNDEMKGRDGDDLMKGGRGKDTIRGGDDDDELHGNEDNDLIYGDAGRDSIKAGSGHDTVYGGSDRDRIWGNSGNDKLNGDDGDDDIYGESGNDTMKGGDGDDVLKGGDGNDWISGGKGNDEVVGNDGDDILYGDSGQNTCRGGDGQDVMDSGCK